MRQWRRSGLALAGALLTAGCLQPDAIEADDAWVRLPAVAGRPASGYFTLHGGPQAATLIAVSADRAIRTEMHESMAMDAGATGAGTMGAGGAMTMRPLASVALPAAGEVTFAPGGRHLMLYGLSPSLEPGDATLLTFSFSDGSRLQRKAWAIGPADPAPE